jgi:hypothetical protein
VREHIVFNGAHFQGNGLGTGRLPSMLHEIENAFRLFSNAWAEVLSDDVVNKYVGVILSSASRTCRQAHLTHCKHTLLCKPPHVTHCKHTLFTASPHTLLTASPHTLLTAVPTHTPC